jgi:hypothetical protein
MISIWDGEDLPPLGCDVLIEHGNLEHAVCTVTGYSVRPSLHGNKFEHRIDVNLLYKDTTTTNQRLLCDVRPLHKPFEKRDERAKRVPKKAPAA